MADLSELFARLGMMAPPRNPAQFPLGEAARFVAPNITSMAMGEPPPPLPAMPETPGKVPSTDDPRVAGAMPEALNLGLLALGPAGIEARGAAAAAPMAARMAPRMAAETAPANMGLNVASMAAGGLLQPTEANAAETKLLPYQRREIEMKRQSAAAQAEAERQRAADQAAIEQQRDQARADQALKSKEAEARIALEQQQASDAYARQQEEAARNAPFREKFPTLTNALPAAGLAAAFLPPAITKAWKQAQANKFAGAWGDAVEGAEALAAKGSKIPAAQKKGTAAQLAAFEQAAPQKLNTTPSLAVTAPSALAAADMPLVPMEYDATMLGPNNPDRQAALGTLQNPEELIKRVLPALMMGVPAATLGTKLPPVGRVVRAPVEESQGLAKIFANPPRKAKGLAKAAP